MPISRAPSSCAADRQAVCARLGNLCARGQVGSEFHVRHIEGLEVTATRLAERLDVSFTLHDSMYLGGDCLLGGDTGGEHVVVQHNEDGEERAEDVDASTIVRVEATTRPHDVEAVANAIGLTLLRREDWQLRSCRSVRNRCVDSPPVGCPWRRRAR